MQVFENKTEIEEYAENVDTYHREYVQDKAGNIYLVLGLKAEWSIDNNEDIPLFMNFVKEVLKKYAPPNLKNRLSDTNSIDLYNDKEEIFKTDPYQWILDNRYIIENIITDLLGITIVAVQE